jgi:hypothetical protein
MNRGMQKSEAIARLDDGEFQWEDLRQLLRDVHPELQGEAGEKVSRRSPAMSKAKAFNAAWDSIRKTSGPIERPGPTRVATVILQEFGIAKQEAIAMAERAGVVHEPLVDIGEE